MQESNNIHAEGPNCLSSVSTGSEESVAVCDCCENVIYTHETMSRFARHIIIMYTSSSSLFPVLSFLSSEKRRLRAWRVAFEFCTTVGCTPSGKSRLRKAMISTSLHHLGLSSVDMDYMFVLAVLILSCLFRV